MSVPEEDENGPQVPMRGPNREDRKDRGDEEERREDDHSREGVRN